MGNAYCIPVEFQTALLFWFGTTLPRLDRGELSDTAAVVMPSVKPPKEPSLLKSSGQRSI